LDRYWFASAIIVHVNFKSERSVEMNKLLLLACLSCFSVPAMASCDDLKAQIDSKLQAKGVKEYTLEVRPIKKEEVKAPDKEASKEKDGKVVGTCEGDSKEIIYKRL
jgi:hypothetical protein